METLSELFIRYVGYSVVRCKIRLAKRQQCGQIFQHTDWVINDEKTFMWRRNVKCEAVINVKWQNAIKCTYLKLN